MKTFYQHRAETIHNAIKGCNDPYLIGGSIDRHVGHLRYSHAIYDYERAKKDFDTDWFGRPPYLARPFYKRVKIMERPEKVPRFMPWIVDIKLRDMFGETVYGKMLQKIRSA